MHKFRFASGFVRSQCVRWTHHQSDGRLKIEKAADDVYWKFFSRNNNMKKLKMHLQLEKTKYFSFDRHMTLFSQSKGYQFVEDFEVRGKIDQQIKVFQAILPVRINYSNSAFLIQIN